MTDIFYNAQLVYPKSVKPQITFIK